MSLPNITRIDHERCIGCGSCMQVCPERSLGLVEGTARVILDASLQCGHCAAVCPEAAIDVPGLEAPAYRSPELSGGRAERVAAADLAALMAMRRSCRCYRDEAVERRLLEDLVRIGATAPSGTNSQAWSFSLLPDRAAVLRLGEAVADFFRLLERLAGSRAVRLASRLAPGDPLGSYWREYHQAVAEALQGWDARGDDRLFHGAPAVILIASRPGATCPTEDALLAAAQILLAAESLGLGTCLVGFAVEALRRDPRIRRRLGLPAGEKVRAAITVGVPDVDYQRPAGRWPPPLRIR